MLVIMPTTFKARTGKHKLYKETSSTRNQLSRLRTVNVYSLSLVSVKLSRAQLLIHRLNATGQFKDCIFHSTNHWTGQPIWYNWLGEKNNHKAALSMHVDGASPPQNSSTKAVSSKPLDSLDLAMNSGSALSLYKILYILDTCNECNAFSWTNPHIVCCFHIPGVAEVQTIEVLSQHVGRP